MVVAHLRAVSVDSGTLLMTISIGPDTEARLRLLTPDLALTTLMATPLVSLVGHGSRDILWVLISCWNLMESIFVSDQEVVLVSFLFVS